MNSGSYIGVKLLEHAMKILKKVLERRIRTLISLNKVQFGIMPGKGIVDARFIVRRMQADNQKQEKRLYTGMCFVDVKKAFALSVEKSAKKSDGVGHEKEKFIRSMVRTGMIFL